VLDVAQILRPLPLFSVDPREGAMSIERVSALLAGLACLAWATSYNGPGETNRFRWFTSSLFTFWDLNRQVMLTVSAGGKIALLR
jgi:hypothetical protein